MTQLGIEPRFPGLLANTLPTRPHLSWFMSLIIYFNTLLAEKIAISSNSELFIILFWTRNGFLFCSNNFLLFNLYFIII